MKKCTVGRLSNRLLSRCRYSYRGWLTDCMAKRLYSVQWFYLNFLFWTTFIHLCTPYHISLCGIASTCFFFFLSTKMYKTVRLFKFVDSFSSMTNTRLDRTNIHKAKFLRVPGRLCIKKEALKSRIINVWSRTLLRKMFNAASRKCS